MRTEQKYPRRRPKLCVANACFKRDVLSIYLSEFHEDLKEPSLRIKERFCGSAMSVIILGDGDVLLDRSRHMRDF